MSRFKSFFKKIAFFFLLLASSNAFGKMILIPMDESQSNHLKAYGIAFWTLEQGVSLDWLLNYRGGSFLLPGIDALSTECVIRGVSYEIIADAQALAIKNEIASPAVNMDVMKLDKPPKIAVYTPNGKQPWDDAVTLVLTYAEIPYEELYDTEVIQGELPQYDWLHLHHEDFTGQYGKFYAAYKNADWYKREKANAEKTAAELGFSKVSELKLNVALKIREFTSGGGFLFSMCSGTDSYDIALAAQHTDICAPMFDGDPIANGAHQHLDFTESFAFQDYKLKLNPLEYEYSTVDATPRHNKTPEEVDYFSLFDFSAKYDPVPTMLTQCHTQIIKSFMGQTTAYVKDYIKPGVIIMGQTEELNSARYIHGTFGEGQWTFYGGHDPEDYQHYVGDPPTDLNLYPNSPGYRLILNNVLFPAAKKKKQKT